MTVTDVQVRNTKLAEYLQVLRLLASELDRAMLAIAGNSISTLEDSIANQQDLSYRLGQLVQEINPINKIPGMAGASLSDCNLREEILAASRTIDRLNHQYAALLQHSSRSVAQMIALFSSFQGNFKEASGRASGYRTWSCQI